MTKKLLLYWVPFTESQNERRYKGYYVSDQESGADEEWDHPVGKCHDFRLSLAPRCFIRVAHCRSSLKELEHSLNDAPTWSDLYIM